MNSRHPVDERFELPDLSRTLDLIAKSNNDGHFAIFAFTTNYRVMLGTPYCRMDIENAPSGRTLEEAMKRCIADYAIHHAPNSELYHKLREQAEWDGVLREHGDSESITGRADLTKEKFRMEYEASLRDWMTKYWDEVIKGGIDK
jgi:hypothetical protein